MSNASLFSTPGQLQAIAAALQGYLRLPFAGSTVPGAIMEALFAYVRGGEVMGTYDFVDVIHRGHRFGWQVKSTKAATPVTWKRAKLPNAKKLIAESEHDGAGRQALGDAIIAFCNAHAQASLDRFNLEAIGYVRLVFNPGGSVTYFERLLCTRGQPLLFRPEDFIWKWSMPKKTVKKEQLPAFHGLHAVTGRKCFAAHILGENQLHFSGESEWWPALGSTNSIRFFAPAARLKLTWEDFAKHLPAGHQPK